MTTAIIIQARWGSSRLPGKVLEDLGGRTVLDHVITRAKRVAGADTVVIASPDDAASDPVAREAERCGAEVFRGSETDVLARYLGAARMVHAGVVMRLTSDCPLIDPQICSRVLVLRAEKDAHYAANNMPPTFPHGLDCEAFTTAALEEAARTTRAPYDREHVTPWLRRAPHLRRVNLAAPTSAHRDQRWTLDYPEDLAFLRAVLAQYPATREPSMDEVLSVLARHPELSAINAMRHQPRA
jgi:spore coat polysaccharide biosynthesis protein SpsF